MGNMKRKQVRAENGRMGSLHALLTRYPDERSCERRLMEVRWPEGWECERCSHHLFVTTGTATRHSEVRPRRRFHAMWLLARPEGACSPSSSPSRCGSRRTRQPSYRGACAAPWRGRSISDVLSGKVEADDSFLVARDRTRGAVHGHAADARGGRAHLGQARTPLTRLAGRPREEVGPVGAHGGGARPGAWVRYSPKGPSKRVGSREPVFELASAPQQPQSSRSSVHPLSHPRYTAYAKPYFSYYGKF